MQRKRNSWMRRHTGRGNLTEENLEQFYQSLEKEIILNYQDPDGIKKGQLIVDSPVTNVKIYKLKYVCPVKNCEESFKTPNGLGSHLKSDEHLWSPKQIRDFLDVYEGIEKESVIPIASVYYEIIEPREILPIPRSVEVNYIERLPKGTRAPTAGERIRHDKEMALWRENMKNLSKRLIKIPELMPNGLYEEAGISRNYWFYRPEIWKAGQWMGISNLDLKKWRETERKRVLMLFRILPWE